MILLFSALCSISCFNGGECTDPNFSNCSCPNGFTGSLCQTREYYLNLSLVLCKPKSDQKTLEKCSAGEIYFFFFQNRFFLNGGSFWYKLTPCVSPFCKLFNILTFRISDNEHCARKIVLRARNAFRTFEKRTPWVSCIKFDVGRKHYRQTLKY